MHPVSEDSAALACKYTTRLRKRTSNVPRKLMDGEKVWAKGQIQRAQVRNEILVLITH